MKKALGQTVRDLKRGVNKKVLKVPGLERKVLDATSNEAWGPHGSHLAEIAQASKNQAELQMIMGVLWKRLSDTGKNWRHVYKALIVLEYLVANGSERVIDEIKEHAHQISALSEFQYVDSSGRDQGSNVRRKSQSLVFLVTDKERVQEARQKASANRDKFSKPGGYSSPGRYGDRYNEDNQTGYGKDDRYGRYGDSASRDGDRSDRESEARYSRDGSVDDEHQEKERNRRADRDGNHADDDGYSSSRGSAVRPDDFSQDGRNDNRRYHEKNPCDPPSYEELSEGRTSVHSERGGDVSVTVPRPASPPADSSTTTTHNNTINGTSEARVSNDPHSFDEFDPRGSAPVPAATSKGAEADLLGSESLFPDNAAHIPTTYVTASGVDVLADSGPGANFSTEFSSFQPFEDPFGDVPFKATPSTDGGPTQAQNSPAFQSTINQGLELVPAQSFAPHSDALSAFDYGTPFGDVSCTPSGEPHDQFSAGNTQMVPSEFPDQETDILAGILPPSVASLNPSQASLLQSFPANDGFGGNHQQEAVPSVTSYLADQSPGRQSAVMNNGYFSHQGFTASSRSYMDSQLATLPHNQPNGGDVGGNFFQQFGSSVPTSVPPIQRESDPQKYDGALQQSKSNTQEISSVAPGSCFEGNMQRNTNSALPQQPSFPLSTSPVTSQGQKEPDAQNYNEGFFEHSLSTVPVTSHMDPEPNIHHDSSGFIQQHNVQQAGPQVQNGQNTQNSNDGFFHQQFTSSVSGHITPGFSHSSTGQHIDGGFLQQAGSYQTNPNLNSQQPGSPQIAHQGPNEQNHHLQSMGVVQQQASTFGNSLGNPQQPNSMLTAPVDMKGQNPQLYSGGFPPQRPASTASGAPLMATVSSFPSNAQQNNGGFPPQHPASTASGAPLMATVSSYPSNAQQNNGGFFQQPGLSMGNPSVNPPGHTELTSQNYNGGFLHQKQETQVIPGRSPTGQYNGGNFLPSSGSSQLSPHSHGTETAAAPNLNSSGLNGIVSQRGQANQISTSQPSATTPVGPLALVPKTTNDKFETKSTVWADTLSRGLVNLNISGSKTNPLADIGIDFDAINRKEKRMEKPAATPVVSTVSMGKAMGSGSGIGRSVASSLRPSAAPMMNPGTGSRFGPGPGMTCYGGITQQPMSGFGGMSQRPTSGYGVLNQQQMGGFGGMNQQQMGGFGGMNQQQTGGFGEMNQQLMGGFGGMNQQPMGGFGVSQQPMGMGFGPGTGMRPGFAMGQGNTMQQPTGLPPGSPFNGGYNPMTGGGGYPSQQPYGGGYQ